MPAADDATVIGCFAYAARSEAVCDPGFISWLEAAMESSRCSALIRNCVHETVVNSPSPPTTRPRGCVLCRRNVDVC